METVTNATFHKRHAAPHRRSPRPRRHLEAILSSLLGTQYGYGISLFDYFNLIPFGVILIDLFKLGNPYEAAAAYGYEGYGAEYAGYGPGEEGYYGYGGGYGGGNAPITIEIEAK
jgi:hypothetical protein